MLGDEGTKESSVETFTMHTTFAEIAGINYSIVHRPYASLMCLSLAD